MLEPEGIDDLQEEPADRRIVGRAELFAFMVEHGGISEALGLGLYFLVSAEEGAAPALIDREALRVHDVVVGEHLLTRIKIEALDALLRLLEGARDHAA